MSTQEQRDRDLAKEVLLRLEHGAQTGQIPTLEFCCERALERRGRLIDMTPLQACKRLRPILLELYEGSNQDILAAIKDRKREIEQDLKDNHKPGIKDLARMYPSRFDTMAGDASDRGAGCTPHDVCELIHKEHKLTDIMTVAELWELIEPLLNTPQLAE